MSALQNNLDQTSSKAACKKTSKGKAALWLPIPPPTPYGSVDQLFDDTRDFIEERLELQTPEESAVLSAFSMTTWVSELFRTTPYINFQGPHGSGKTTGLDVLKLTCYKAIQSSNMTHSAIFRVLDRDHPTLLLDETEIYTALNDEAREIQKLLNAGYKRNNPVIRCNKETFEPEAFDCFGPKVFAGTRQLSPTLQDRCLKIPMVKNSNPVRVPVDGEADCLRAKLSGFRADVLTKRLDLFDVFDQDPQRAHTSLRTFLCIDDGRCIELYGPLLIAVGFLSACKGQEGQKVKSEKLLGFDKFIELKRHAQTRIQTGTEVLQNGVDAQILKALGALNLKTDMRFRALTVAEQLNTGRSLCEQTTTKTVGWALSRLGFQTSRMQDGNKAWLFNEKLWLNRMTQYGLEPPSTPETRDSYTPLSISDFYPNLTTTIPNSPKGR
jgi:hypothetical protein